MWPLLYIARWQDHFGHVEEHEFSIHKGRDGLIKVGYVPPEVDRLLNDLSILPARTVLLTFSENEAVTAGVGD